MTVEHADRRAEELLDMQAQVQLNAQAARLGFPPLPGMPPFVLTAPGLQALSGQAADDPDTAQADRDFLEAIRRAEEEEAKGAPADGASGNHGGQRQGVNGAGQCTSPTKMRRVMSPLISNDAAPVPVARGAVPPGGDSAMAPAQAAAARGVTVHTCSECRGTAMEGAVDEGNGLWYCKLCWDQVFRRQKKDQVIGSSKAACAAGAAAPPRVVIPPGGLNTEAVAAAKAAFGGVPAAAGGPKAPDVSTMQAVAAAQAAAAIVAQAGTSVALGLGSRSPGVMPPPPAGLPPGVSAPGTLPAAAMPPGGMPPPPAAPPGQASTAAPPASAVAGLALPGAANAANAATMALALLAEGTTAAAAAGNPGLAAFGTDNLLVPSMPALPEGLSLDSPFAGLASLAAAATCVASGAASSAAGGAASGTADASGATNGAKAAAGGDTAPDAPVGQADGEARTAQWAQVFSAMLQSGIEDRASEYAQYLGKLQEVTKECLKRYHEAVEMEEQLLATASHEAAQAHVMAQVQKQAQAEMASQGTQVKAEVAAAHQAAALVVAEQEKSGVRTSKRYPKRPGMPPCQYFQRTGDCHYGVTCKWDHPERDQIPLNSKGYPLRPDQTPCAFYMRTGECKFGSTCKWDHPESVATAAMNATTKLAALAASAAAQGAALQAAAVAQGAL
mmetsp:Transcript_106241/g.298794  ORF Transcript_106241/g.298794 Transcript_106241/m.298794 type:complete len:673 (-) Transcript_106241:94-2112(-)